MGYEWPIRQLKDVSDEVTVGYVGTMADQYVDQGVLFLRSLNIRPFGLDLSDVKFVAHDFHEKIRKSALNPGNVVIVRTGRPGTCAVIPEGLGQLNCSDLVIVRCSPELRPHFACYWINAMASDHVHAYSVGAVQQHFNVSSAKVIPIPVPSLLMQDQVLSVLRSLDDRIDLLRQTNTTLEAIAQTLFKSWFVDFGPVHAKAEGREPKAMDAATTALFPSEFEESELGPIPKGWSVKSFGDSITILGGGTPKTSIPEYWDGDIPWFSVVDAPAAGQVFTLDTTKKITRLGLENCSAKLLPPMTTIISARGTVGKVAMTGSEMVMNQSCYGLQPKVVGGEPFTYFSTLRFVDGLQQIAHGAVFDTITRSSFEQLSACRPPDDAIARFGAMTAPLLDRIRINGHQAISLAQLRDTLLPRLISGKLHLPEATEAIEATLADRFG